MHPTGELGTARAAAAVRHTLIASTVSTHSITEIREAYGGPVWFQLYPTDDLAQTEALLHKAEAAGCPVCALTVDTPVIGNRESQKSYIQRLLQAGGTRLGNFDDLGAPAALDDPALTWDFIGWLRERTRMRIVIKGIVTAEDAELTVRHAADGLIVSNHGGRQLESNRGTLEALPEIVATVAGRLPVLIDGGIMRGTDIFKALALGADAICIGRAYIWGLATFGQEGVEQVLRLLRAELVRDMQLAGVRSIGEIGVGAVRVR
jgi:isopentenyl diphosphate isomerase/L-lactate dehydrogenase-like FMN-dependent dehydrogenase